MATTGYNGRDLTIDWDATTLVGVQSRSLSMTNELVEITSDDDSGWTNYLAKAGKKGIEVKVDGVYSAETLIAEFFNNAVTGETTVANLPSGLTTPGDFTGTFLLQSLELSADHDGEVKFSATFVSKGAVTYTASA